MVINNLRFELSFKTISQLEKKLNFCKLNSITNINIPCKGIIKKEFLDATYEYIKYNHNEFNVVFHYSLYHQYSKNKDNSYKEFLDFSKKINSNSNFDTLLVSGSNKKKDFDSINVLNILKKDKDCDIKLGIAFNPYLRKYFNFSLERERYNEKISSGLIKSTWLQFGTDIKLLENEIKYIKNDKFGKINLFGSILIPSKQFIARFKFRPWKQVYIADKYLSSLNDFFLFTKDLISFYIENNITPVIETDFTSSEKLDIVKSLFKN